jgi:hypothetical protein
MSGRVADLAARGARVWWKCQECQASGAVDLERIAAAKGDDYDLTDKTAACRTAGCGYWVNFYAQAGLRNWPLKTEAGLLAEMDRRSAWLAGQHHSLGMPARGPAPGAAT